MAIINQNFEKSLRKRFKKLKNQQNQQPKALLFGSVKQMLSYVKAVVASQKHINVNLQETVYAFEKLEPTDLVAYSKDYQIGFPVGIGALKYYASANNLSSISDSASSIMDLPDGAENKLNHIMHNQDPFKYAPSEVLNKIKNIL